MKQILVIENERRHLEFSLEMAQMELDDAVQFSFLEQVKSNYRFEDNLHYDLYLVDILLGPASVMDGYSVVRKLKDLGVTADRIAVISGHTKQALKEGEDSIAGIEVLRKPIGYERLVQMFCKRLHLPQPT